jgi:hypothetical protein
MIVDTIVSCSAGMVEAWMGGWGEMGWWLGGGEMWRKEEDGGELWKKYAAASATTNAEQWKSKKNSLSDRSKMEFGKEGTGTHT